MMKIRFKAKDRSSLAPAKSPFRGQEGSVTMEYILINFFAFIVTAASLTILGTVVKDKIQEMTQEVGTKVKVDEKQFNVFDKK